MSKIILPSMGIDKDVFERIEELRAINKEPRATYINRKLREVLLLPIK